MNDLRAGFKVIAQPQEDTSELGDLPEGFSVVNQPSTAPASQGFMGTLNNELTQGYQQFKEGVSTLDPAADHSKESIFSPLNIVGGPLRMAISPITAAGRYAGEKVQDQTQSLGPNVSAGLGTAVDLGGNPLRWWSNRQGRTANPNGRTKDSAQAAGRGGSTTRRGTKGHRTHPRLVPAEG